MKNIDFLNYQKLYLENILILSKNLMDFEMPPGIPLRE